MNEIVNVQLLNVDDDTGSSLNCVVQISDRGITLSFDGYGDKLSNPGYGEPILIENRDGVPHVVVWSDINQEDPTHTISLVDASEEKRIE